MEATLVDKKLVLIAKPIEMKKDLQGLLMGTFWGFMIVAIIYIVYKLVM